jgi:hypothetical protein
MEWLSRKTSIAGIEIFNWVLVLTKRYRRNLAYLQIHCIDCSGRAGVPSGLRIMMAQ